MIVNETDNELHVKEWNKIKSKIAIIHEELKWGKN